MLCYVAIVLTGMTRFIHKLASAVTCAVTLRASSSRTSSPAVVIIPVPTCLILIYSTLTVIPATQHEYSLTLIKPVSSYVIIVYSTLPVIPATQHEYSLTLVRRHHTCPHLPHPRLLHAHHRTCNTA